MKNKYLSDTEALRLILKNDISFGIDQDGKHEAFCVRTQRQTADSKREVLQKISDIIARQDEERKAIRNGPTLEELVNDTSTPLKEMNHFRYPEHRTGDPSGGYGKEVIERMREVGIKETKREMYERSMEFLMGKDWKEKYKKMVEGQVKKLFGLG